jgi:L-threonylcarbamoyladenylate synthase
MVNSTFRVFRCSEKGAVASSASIVNKGGVLVFPTDTVYGIGCSPYLDKSIERIFRIKGRQEDKPLPVLSGSIRDVEEIAILNQTGRVLAENYWPGALTIVSRLKDIKISSKVTAGRNTIATRIPDNSCTLELLAICRHIIGTSANPSGHPSPKTPDEVISSNLNGFDALLDGGPTKQRIESTIVDISGPEPRVLREGAIRAAEIYNLFA